MIREIQSIMFTNICQKEMNLNKQSIVTKAIYDGFKLYLKSDKSFKYNAK